MASETRARLVTVADQAAWQAYVAGQPAATGYHDWRWPELIGRVFAHENVSLVAERTHDDGTHAVVGVLPLVHIRSRLFGRSITSLPFLNYGGVLADDEAAAQTLVDAARREAASRRCGHVELRHFDRRFPDLPCREHKVTMHLAIADGMWEGFDRKVRNQIRKAQKSGLTVERGGTALLDDFYPVFARNMRDLGTPVYPRRFFEAVLETFAGEAHVVVVRLGSEPVAAGISYRSGGTVEVPWASSVREHNRLCPNHLLYWTVIEQAVADGCRRLDFGRSTPGEGTFKFKEQWGAQPVALTWEYVLLRGDAVPDQSPKNPKFRLAIATWQRLPLWVANTAGPHIVRGIP